MGPFPAGGGVDAAGLGLFSPFYSLVPPSGELMGAAAAFVQLQKEMQLLSLRDLCPPPCCSHSRALFPPLTSCAQPFLHLISAFAVGCCGSIDFTCARSSSN